MQLSFAVATAPQTLAFTSTPPFEARVGGSYRPTVTSTAGLLPVITVAPASSEVCYLSGGTVELVATGSCELLADQAGDTDYAPAAEVSQTFAVGATPTPSSPAPSGPAATSSPAARAVLDPLQTDLVLGGPHESKVGLRVTCLDGPCDGTVQLITTRRGRHRLATVVLARAACHIRSSRATTVELSLERATPAARRLAGQVAKAGRLRVTLQVTLTGQRPVSQPVYLTG